MNKKLVKKLVMYTLAITFVGSIVAGEGKQFCKRSKCDSLLKDLNLTKEQNEQFEQLRKKHLSKMDGMKQSKQEFSNFLSTEFQKSQLDKQALLNFMKKDKAVNPHEMMLDSIIEFHKILTPEQRATLVKACNDRGCMQSFRMLLCPMQDNDE